MCHRHKTVKLTGVFFVFECAWYNLFSKLALMLLTEAEQCDQNPAGDCGGLIAIPKEFGISIKGKIRAGVRYSAVKQERKKKKKHRKILLQENESVWWELCITRGRAGCSPTLQSCKCHLIHLIRGPATHRPGGMLCCFCSLCHCILLSCRVYSCTNHRFLIRI